MDTNPLFTIALGLSSPWEVQRTEFDAARRVLRLRVDFKAGSRFTCPECGTAGCPIHDTERVGGSTEPAIACTVDRGNSLQQPPMPHDPPSAVHRRKTTAAEREQMAPVWQDLIAHCEKRIAELEAELIAGGPDGRRRANLGYQRERLARYQERLEA